MSNITYDDNFHYVEITRNVWQVKDDGLSYFTLLRGKKLAIVWDAGYGVRDIRAFVEKNINTPYIVIISHAHPDHITGSFRFKEAYLPEKDMPFLDFYNSEDYRRKLIAALDNKIKENEAVCDMLINAVFPKFNMINPGDRFDLGGLHVQVVDLAGHSKGSIGLLIEEEHLLLSGDALNRYLWIFNKGACPLKEVLGTLEKVVMLPFDRFLGGHGTQPLSKDVVYAHINNLKNFTFNPDSFQIRVGCETYSSIYNENGIRSEIIYDKSVL